MKDTTMVPGPGRRRRSSRRGGAAVEFALVMPRFMGLVMGALDYGYFFYSSQIVTNAAREGARAGVLANPGDTSGATSAATSWANNYMTANAVGCPPPGGTSCISVTTPT